MTIEKCNFCGIQANNEETIFYKPRADADGEIDLIEVKINTKEWISATKERLIELPKIINYLKIELLKSGINQSEYKLYLYGSLARGQCRGLKEKPYNSSDIDLAICDSNSEIGERLSSKLLNAIYNIRFENISDVEVSLGRPPDFFDKGHCIKLT
jgi:predicted nucleotidyltransferase